MKRLAIVITLISTSISIFAQDASGGLASPPDQGGGSGSDQTELRANMEEQLFETYSPYDFDYDYNYLDGSTNWREAQWRSPAFDPDLYDPTNIWDPTVQDYGSHFDWNPVTGTWQPDFGWHSSRYDYTQDARPRQAEPFSARNQPGTNGTPRTVEGTVAEMKVLPLGNSMGHQQDHTLAKLTLRDGRSLVVDFGERGQIARKRLNPGNEIKVRGRTGRISGRRVLFAIEVSLDGNTFSINHGPPEDSPSSGNEPTRQD